MTAISSVFWSIVGSVSMNRTEEPKLREEVARPVVSQLSLYLLHTCEQLSEWGHPEWTGNCVLCGQASGHRSQSRAQALLGCGRRWRAQVNHQWGQTQFWHLWGYTRVRDGLPAVSLWRVAPAPGRCFTDSCRSTKVGHTVVFSAGTTCLSDLSFSHDNGTTRPCVECPRMWSVCAGQVFPLVAFHLLYHVIFTAIP